MSIQTIIFKPDFVNPVNILSIVVRNFCRRHRAVPEGQSTYTAQLDTLSIQPTKIIVQVVDTKNNVPLMLELSALKGNMVRLRINELKPLRPRYEPPVGDVLVNKPEEEK